MGASPGEGGLGRPCFRTFGHPELPKPQSTEVFSWVFFKTGSIFAFLGYIFGFSGGPKVVKKWSIFGFSGHFLETTYEKTSVLWGFGEFSTGFRVFGPP